MASDKVSATFTCRKCGGTVIETPDNPTDSSRVKCKFCGTDVGSWGELKRASVETVMKAVHKEIKDTLRKALKGSKNIRIKWPFFYRS